MAGNGSKKIGIAVQLKEGSGQALVKEVQDIFNSRKVKVTLSARVGDTFDEIQKLFGSKTFKIKHLSITNTAVDAAKIQEQLDRVFASNRVAIPKLTVSAEDIDAESVIEHINNALKNGNGIQVKVNRTTLRKDFNEAIRTLNSSVEGAANGGKSMVAPISLKIATYDAEKSLNKIKASYDALVTHMSGAKAVGDTKIESGATTEDTAPTVTEVKIPFSAVQKALDKITGLTVKGIKNVNEEDLRASIQSALDGITTLNLKNAKAVLPDDTKIDVDISDESIVKTVGAAGSLRDTIKETIGTISIPVEIQNSAKTVNVGTTKSEVPAESGIVISAIDRASSKIAAVTKTISDFNAQKATATISVNVADAMERITALKNKLNEFAATTVRATVAIDVPENVASELENLNGKKASVGISAINRASSKFKLVIDELNNLNGKKATVEIDADSGDLDAIFQAIAKKPLAESNDALSKTVEFIVNLDESLKGARASADGLVKALNQVPATFKNAATGGAAQIMSKTASQVQSEADFFAEELSSHLSTIGSTSAYSGFQLDGTSINGTKATYTLINQQLQQSKTFTLDLADTTKSIADRTSEWLAKLENIKVQVKDISPTYERQAASAEKEKAALEKLLVSMEQYREKKGNILKENNPILFNDLSETIRQIKDGTIGLDDARTKFNAIKIEAYRTSADVKTIWQQLKGAWGTAVKYFSAYNILREARAAIRELVSTVSELDQSMTQLSIVSNESMKTIESNFGNISKAAKEAGADITDLMASMENYARMGYNMQESTDLAKLTSIYSNVGDISVDDATTSAVSILKAYGLSVNELKQAFDSMTKVDQDFAISTGDLGVAFQNTGSQLAATGASVNETIALITAANSSIQDASKTANALKTISMRLRSQNLTQKEREELSELSGEDIDDIVNNSSKYRNEILGMTGVDIKENESTYKSIYQIILEISKVWDHLSDTQRATLTEDIAGKRNSSVLMSLISNVDDMEAAYADAENAMGTLDAANAKYLDSIEGRQKAFQASYQSLAHTLVNSNFVKVFYDMGNGAMQFAEGLQKVHLLIPSVIAGLVALNAAMKTFQATSGVVKLLSAPTTTLESAVQVLGALPTDQQHLAGLMLQGMNPAKKSQIQGANWLQAVLLRGNMGSFFGLDNDELKDIVKNNPDVVNLDAVENLAEDVGERISEGMKSGGEVAVKTTGTVFEALKAKVKAGLTGIRKLLTGGFGTGAAVAGWAGVAVGIGAAIYKIIDTINTKRIEAYGKLKQEISDTENKIKEAQSQLEQNNAAIEEYTEKKIAAGALSLTDQTTLDTLKAEQNELQVNIELWEAYAEARKQELSDKAWDALKAEAAEMKNQVELVTDVNDYKDFIQAANALSTSDENLKLASDKSSDKYDLKLVSWLSASGYYQDEAKWRETMVTNATGWLDANRDQLNDLVYGTDKNIDELIDSYHRLDAYVLTTSGNWDSAFSTLINAPEFEKTKSYLEGIVDMYGGTADNISRMAEQIKTDGEDKLNKVDLSKFLDTLEELGFTVNRTDFTGLITQFAQVEDAIEGLGKSTNSLYQFQNAMEGVDAEVDDWEKGEKKRKSGTEAFTSYAETYKEFIDRIKKYDIDEGIVAQDVERLIGADKIIELGGDKDKIKKYINEYVKPLFGNANNLGGGLPKRLLELSKGWKENAEGVREFKNAEGQLIMSVDKANDRWDISSEHMDEAAKALGITTQALYALMAAIDTWGEIDKISDEDLENKILESNMGISLAGGKKGVMVAELTAEWTSAGINAVEQGQLIARLTKSKNVIVLDAELTGNTKENIEKLKEIGLISEGKFRTVDVDDRGKRILAPTERIANIEGIAKVFKQMGKDFGATWEEINDIIKESGISEEIYNQEVRLNDLIKAYSDGAVDIQNFYDTITVGGKKVKIIKFGSLEESLRDAGFSAENIDKILRKLANERGEVRISAYMDWSNYRERDLKSRLRSMGILSVGENGQYTLNIDALVKTTIDQGGSMDDAEGAVQQIVNLFNGTPLSLNLDTLEEEVKTAWDKAISGKTTEANELADASEKAADASERAEKALKGSDGDLTSIISKVRTIRSMAITIANMFASAFKDYSNLPTPEKPGDKPDDGAPEYGATAATGKNNDKYSGLSLVGELGPEIRATDGMVEVVGKNGPEVITVGKDDIIIDADTTAGILKKTGGVIDGIASNANYGGSLSYTPPGGGSGSSSSSSSSSKSKDAWERFYKDLKHRREMDEIDDKQYYAALEANYRNYLDTSKENLDTWQSVVEEIYKGNYSTLTDLWNNELSEWDHRIAMEEATEADKIAWMKSHYSEYLSDNIQQHKDYQKAIEEIRSGEYKLLTDAWEKELAEWDHKIAMEEAEEAEKTEWMKANLGNYLSDNLTQHSDYEKALESIYDGEAEAQTKAWDEIKDNLDRQLAMNEITEKEYWYRYAKAYRDTLVGNQKKVAEERLKADKDYYEATKKLAEDAIKAQTDKLKRQLDNQIITNRNYLTQLAQLYEKNYAKINELDADSVEARKDALNDLYSARKDYASNNANDIKSLHDLVVEAIKDVKNQEIDQLEETAANLETIADLRKQALDDLETENDYIRQQRNLQTSAAQIEAELEMMKSDTSAAGMAKRRKLQEQLFSAQADLSDFEREHSISNQKKQIDEELKEKTKQLDEQKKEIQKYLANEIAVNNDAWVYINEANAKGVEGIKDLYDGLSDYALSFGKDIQGEIDTVVAKFQEAMKAVTKDFGIAMKAFADSGMGPIAMLNVLEQADVKFGDNVRADVTKALREGGGDNINYGWNDMSEAAMFAALATATDEIGASLNLSTIADIVQRKAQQALLLPESKASDFTKEFKERGISVSEVVNALNEKLEAEGSTLRANAEDYETLNKWLEENEVSTYLFTKAVDEHSKSVTRNKFAWNGAVRAAKEGASEWIRVASQFENVNNWIKSCDSSYGAFKLSLQSADIEIPPDFERFITGLKDKIKGNPTALYETFDEAMTGITKSASEAQGGKDGKGGLHGILGLMNGDIDETVGKLAMITPNASGEKSKVDQVKDGLKTVFDWMGKVVEGLKSPTEKNDDPMGLNTAADSTQNFHDNLKNLAENIPGYANVIAAAMGKINDAQKGDSTQNPSGFTNDDVRKVLQAASGEVTLTPAEAVRYDLNFDGVITEADAELMQRMVGKLDTGIGYTGEPSSESNPALDKVLDGVVSIFGIMGAAVDDYNNVLTGKGTFSGEPVPEANKEAVKETTETILGVGKKIIGLLGKPEPEAVPEGNAEYVEQTSEALGGILKNLFGAIGRASGAYASGTSSVPANGMYTIDEGMRDELIYDPSKNALISYLNAKSIVFPADVSAKMKALYNNPSLLNTPIGSPSIPRMDATVNAVSVGDISMGDIIIQGNTNEKTVAQIRAEQKRQAQYIGDIFEREQRFAGTIR